MNFFLKNCEFCYVKSSVYVNLVKWGSPNQKTDNWNKKLEITL